MVAANYGAPGCTAAVSRDHHRRTIALALADYIHLDGRPCCTTSRGRRSGHPGGGAGAGAHCDAYRRYGGGSPGLQLESPYFIQKLQRPFQPVNQKKSVSNTYNLLLNILALTISHQKLTFIAASNYTLLSQNEKRPLVFGWNLGILIIVYTSERKIERQREDCQKVAHHC